MLIPAFQPVFKVVPLDFNHWLTVLALAASTIPMVEIWKLIYFRHFCKDCWFYNKVKLGTGTQIGYNRFGTFVAKECDRVETNSGQERRRHLRIIAKSIIVSLTNKQNDQQISRILKDISEGGMKIQKISAKRQSGKRRVLLWICIARLRQDWGSGWSVGFGSDAEKFSEHLIRMRFLDLDPAIKDKIEKYIADNRAENETIE